jgi:esterase/lipase superfamily enzyme
MELLVFGHSGIPLIVFPTRCGRFYDFENFGMVHALREIIHQGKFRLVCVDSVDAEAFYCDWKQPAERIAMHERYDQYLLHEVLPFAKGLGDGFARVATLGCSLGAYHACNFAFRYPHLVCQTVGLSGRYNLTETVADFRDLLDGFYNEAVYFHTPNHFLTNLADPAILGALREMRIVLAVGEADPFLESNRALSHCLHQLHVPHELHVWGGRAHKPVYWQQMLQHYL